MAYLVGVKDNEQELEGSYNTLKCVQASWQKLFAYEDTGLMPEEITEAQKAMKAALGLACQVQSLKAERDAAVAGLQGVHKCECCKNDGTDICRSCYLGGGEHNNFEWQGV